MKTDYGMRCEYSGSMDAAAMIGMIDNPQLGCLVEEARPLLQQALSAINASD